MMSPLATMNVSSMPAARGRERDRAGGVERFRFDGVVDADVAVAAVGEGGLERFGLEAEREHDVGDTRLGESVDQVEDHRPVQRPAASASGCRW